MSRFAIVLIIVAAGLSAQQETDKTVVVNRTAAAAGDGNYTWRSDAGPVLALHGADIRFEGPPVTNAPYSADAVTETVQTLADGNTIRRENTAKVYRDSQGRVRREETIQSIGPWSTGERSRTTIFINDPVADTHYVLREETKTATKMPAPTLGHRARTPRREAGEPAVHHREVKVFQRSSSSSSSSSSANASEQPKVARSIAIRAVNMAPAGEQQRESLGTKIIEGLEAEGTRTTMTIPAEQVGAERDIIVIDERWHSPELGVDLLTKHSDPRMGETTYRLTNIQRGEQPLTLFEPPADFEVQDAGKHIELRTKRKGPKPDAPK